MVIIKTSKLITKSEKKPCQAMPIFFFKQVYGHDCNSKKQKNAQDNGLRTKAQGQNDKANKRSPVIHSNSFFSYVKEYFKMNLVIVVHKQTRICVHEWCSFAPTPPPSTFTDVIKLSYDSPCVDGGTA